MQFNGNSDLGGPPVYADTASRIFQALEYLATIARKDNLPALAAHIDQALEASLNDYVEAKRAVLAARYLMLQAECAADVEARPRTV